MVVICVIALMLIYGTRNAFSVFFSPILAEFGWSRAEVSVMLSLNLFSYGLFAPVAGLLAERWNPRLSMLFGLVVLGTATAGCSLSNTVWHFYFLFGVLMPLGMAFSGWPLMAPALMNWFFHRRGLVLGFAQAGAGLSFVYGIFVGWTIFHLGWRNTFLVLASILLLILLPVYMFFFHYHPKEMGLQPYGGRMDTENEISSSQRNPLFTDAANSSILQILQNFRAWMLVSSFALFWGMGGYTVIAHIVKFIEDVGFSRVYAVSIYAIIGMSLVAGQLSGFISDQIGRENTGTIASGFCIFALACLISLSNPSQSYRVYLSAICFGYGAGLIVPTITAACADIFFGRLFGAVAGLLLTGMGFGGVAGPWVGGYLFDITGSYLATFLLCALSFMLSCICLWIAAPRKKAEKK
jgi:sugar phosphate permease